MKSRATTKAIWSRSKISKPAEAACKNIALTGFMAVGKSAVGKKLARKLNWRFVDLDRAIERQEGLSVPEIFARKGEPYFRELESRLLRQSLAQDRQVIATGGGAIVDKNNLRLLKEQSLLICLTAPGEILAKRAKNGKGRPLLSGEAPQKRIRELFDRRREAYAEAHVTIETAERSVDEVVEEIFKTLQTMRFPAD